MLPKLVLPSGPHTTESLALCFAAPANTTLSLEIGFGGGEHLSALARASPDMSFIGAEPFINGIVSLLRHIDNQNLQNIRIWPDDVRLILGNLPESSLSAVYVMFPDPWPKARHASRRIFNPTMLDRLAFCLKKGGVYCLPVIIPWQNHGCWLKLCVTRHSVGRRIQPKIGVNVLLIGRRRAIWQRACVKAVHPVGSTSNEIRWQPALAIKLCKHYSIMIKPDSKIR